MTKYIALIALLFWIGTSTLSKAFPRRKSDVPAEMQFANIRVLFDAEAREMIQGQVDKFVQMGYYNNCVLRAKLYFPIIEQALVRQHTPTDLKYLSLLSSQIIPNHQAPDGSIGLWQITDSLAKQIGLTVSSEVDERMNVALSSESIARHLTEKNYTLRNWIYTIMSYRMEIVDLMKDEKFDKSLIGANQLNITAKTPHSILNLLAYVIAYKDQIDAPPLHTLDLLTYNEAKGKSLKEIADFTKLPHDQVRNFNKWLLVDKVPTYKSFPVLLPVPRLRTDEVSQLIKIEERLAQSTVFDTTNKYPVLTNKTPKRYRDKSYMFAQANGLSAIIAGEGDRTADMADAANIDLKKFRAYNEMSRYDDVKERQVYYLEKKNRKTDAKEHVLEEGESFWDVSQRYGIHISTLITNNRLTEKDTAKVGRVVWLKEKRPENTPIEYRKVATDAIFVQPDNSMVVTPDNSVKNEVILPKNNLPVTNSTGTVMDNDSIYIVKANETILDVYRKTNVSFDELVKINDLKTPNVYEGQQIRLKPYTNVAKVNAIIPTDPNFTPPNADEVANPNMTVTTTDDNIGKVITDSTFHIIQKGETVSAIAGKYKISMANLKKWNSINEKGNIRVGQKLRLTAPAASAITNPMELAKVDTADVVHTVVAKESLWGIAKKYGIEQADIAKMNQLDDKNGIKIGQKLTVKRRTAPRNTIGNGSPVQIETIPDQTPNQTPNNLQTPTNTEQTGVVVQTNDSEMDDLTKITMPYVVNPPSSGGDIIEVNPAVDHFSNLKKRYYLDNDDLAKWNGIELEDVIGGTIPSDRRTLAVTEQGYKLSLQGGNVIYPKKIENTPVKNNQQGNNYQPTNPQNTNNQQQVTNSQPQTNTNTQQAPPQTANTQGGGTQTAAGGETKKIPVSAFSDNFFDIKTKYNLTDEDIIRLNPTINVEAVKGGYIPMEVTELVISGSAGGGTATNTQVEDTGTQNNYVEPATTGGKPTTEHVVHEVGYGDNVYKLAKQYNVHTDSIHKWNNIPHEKPIDKGDKLIVSKKEVAAIIPSTVVTNTIPVEATPTDKPAYHILKKGETMYGLSKTYNVPIKDLVEYNPKIFKDNLIRNGDTVFLKKPEIKGMLSKASLSTDSGYYTVQEGDDMYKICEKFKVKPSDLKVWNKLAPGVGVTKPIPTGTKLVVDADLADALKNKTGEMPISNFNDEPTYHFVQKGETLSSIAKKFNTSPDDLKAMNNRQDGNLREGEKLLVGKTYYHTVSKGETLTGIAQKYKITNEELKTLNRKKDNIVKEGEKLIVGK